MEKEQKSSPKETPIEKEKNLLCASLSFSFACMKI
jgi:hypothetical protein